MRGPSVVLEDVWFRYSKNSPYMLRGASLEMDPSVINFVTGDVGVGKTTLLYLITGLLEPEKGKISVNGVDPKKIDKKVFGFAFQNPDDQILCAWVRDEIAYTVKQVDRYGYEDKVKDVARRLGILDILDRKTRELSFGQKKLLTIASAIVHDPEIIILDEPFAFLSKRYRRIVEEVIVEELEEGKLVIVTGHEASPILDAPVLQYELEGGEIKEVQLLDSSSPKHLL